MIQKAAAAAAYSALYCCFWPWPISLHTCIAPQVVPLNRYVLDYWKHKQKLSLVEANGLRESDAWQHLFRCGWALVGSPSQAVPGPCRACPRYTYAPQSLVCSFSDILRAVAVALGKMLEPASGSGTAGTGPSGGEGEESSALAGARFDPLVYCLDRLAKEYRSKFKDFNSPMAAKGYGA